MLAGAKSPQISLTEEIGWRVWDTFGRRLWKAYISFIPRPPNNQTLAWCILQNPHLFTVCSSLCCFSLIFIWIFVLILLIRGSSSFNLQHFMPRGVFSNEEKKAVCRFVYCIHVDQLTVLLNFRNCLCSLSSTLPQRIEDGWHHYQHEWTCWGSWNYLSPHFSLNICFDSINWRLPLQFTWFYGLKFLGLHCMEVSRRYLPNLPNFCVLFYQYLRRKKEMAGMIVDLLMSLKSIRCLWDKMCFVFGGAERGLFHEKLSQLVFLLSNYDVKDPTNLRYEKLKPHLF